MVKIYIFWLDPWVGRFPLMVAYPRLYALEVNKLCSIADRRVGDNWVWNWSSNIRPESRTGSQLQNMESLIHHIHLVNSEDKWSWDLGPDGVFSVVGTCRALHDHFLDDGDRPTRWSRLVPIKVNILTWRACVDSLPTRVNLVSKAQSTSYWNGLILVILGLKGNRYWKRLFRRLYGCFGSLETT
ncbi:RNA-directed DNA polymerase, eukaryota, Reverse transcriptase zinc-binding domain protein [Artemisia annua]|uniref:RNA-directed DNA polymerase, eukaryota, Reverse transcriptase zinc-binding domain protein n=1 Tax=Artemisia annua TaxID=35608 RepID=A0A2U1LZM0_ARTAN|nr:RNA-directed DNA polymerase, eukaryota, Reverse transcriptase zinc-binding domain protein [Artemisia annua]